MDEFFREEEEVFAQDEEFGEYEQDKSSLQAEVAAFERVGPSGRLAELISTATAVSGMGDMYKLAHEHVSPEDRFMILVDAISRRMNGDGIANISQVDIDNMLEKTQLVPGLRYKNPVAYIMGFLATNGGSKMNKDTVMYVLKTVLPKMADEGGVEAPDVIRYARYWKQFL